MVSAAVEPFTAADGDAYYARNKAALETAVERDWALRLIKRNGLQPRFVFEVGCANGWRLAEIQRRHQSICTGMDISWEAIAAGHRQWTELILVPASICDRFVGRACFNLVICSFVLHWVARDRLDAAIHNIDTALKPGGHLVLQDFDPPEPVDVPYHHRPGVFTYKRDYAALFLALGYHVVDSRHWNHETGEGIADQPDAERAVCWLLRKGEA